MSRLEYCETLIYRTVFLLSGFRRLIGDSGSDFLQDLEDFRIQKVLPQPFSDAETMMALIDNGFESLTGDELKIYAEYICDLYDIPKYRRASFFSLLTAMAEKLPKDIECMSEPRKAHERAIAISTLLKN